MTMTRITGRTTAAALALVIALASAQGAFAQKQPGPGSGQGKPPPAPKSPAEMYTIEQSVSDKAQLSTIAFSALAFVTGTFGADTFLPPGKVADFFGFQYMRDIDAKEAGHNMMFLTNIGNNVLAMLDSKQEALLLALAREQEPLFAELGRKRLVLIKAFRDNMEGKRPAGTTGLSEKAVTACVADIFAVDGRLAFRRAQVYGQIVKTLTAAQKTAIARLKFGDSGTWPALPDQYDKRTMTHGQDVLYMTYASEFFSWYAGSETADVYFCPERHGTYFGGFYMKDYPAMGNADYFIPTALTGDSGEAFIALLTPEQAALVTGIMEPLAPILQEILAVRTSVSKEFRKYLSGVSANEAAVAALSRRYGELDGRLSFQMAYRFAAVHATLTAAQKADLATLRNQDIFPSGYYLYADPVDGPVTLETAFLFSK
ncbi:MAG: hypothetical protein NT080_06605 [Spirochaetes bacterium]|nr:hypothetical protein [Spirochaetota bacterium]